MSFESNGNVLEIKNADKVKFVGTSNTVIDNLTGRIGVGIDEPTSALDVNGDVEFRSNVQFGTEMSITNFDVKSNVQIGTDTMNNTLTVNGAITKTQYNPGEIIEELTTVCNGRPVTVQSGTYTPTNVTASQTSSATHTEINGSNITYNKPAGAKRIYYKFACQWDDAGHGAISNFKIRVYHNDAWRDINPSRYTHAAQYLNDGNHHGQAWVINEYIFECDAETESQHDGRFLSSKTSYTFDVTWRQHGASSYYSRLHINEWWDGSDTDVVHPPQLTIRAIA
jgi:hypothetical protein